MMKSERKFMVNDSVKIFLISYKAVFLYSDQDITFEC